MNISIDLSSITDWQSFHSEFKKALGFPEFYGMNMDAWIDCMSYIDDLDSGMTSVGVEMGSTLVLDLAGWGAFQQGYSKIAEELIECTKFVNQRFKDQNSQTRVSLNFR